MDLTTEARVAQLVNPGGALSAHEEARFHRLILQVSAEAERYMDRGVQVATRTEYFDVNEYQRVFQLKAWPVTAVTSVHFDPEQAFAADKLLVAGDDYLSPVLDGLGMLELRGSLVLAGRYPKSLKVISTGGMASTTEEFVSLYPDIAGAIDHQVVHLWRHGKNSGVQSVSSEFGTVLAPAQPLREWLPFVWTVLNRHRRIAIAS